MSESRLGAFRLVAPVGQGGMATVWRAVHEPTGVDVALKVLDRGQRAPALEALRTEIEAAAALSHPAVLTVYDHGQTTEEAERTSSGAIEAGRPWLAVELASGGTLATPPARPRPWREIRGILDLLLDALAHAHARGVIHRDLKPANVLIAGPDDLRPGLKIADFGIAAAGEDRFRRRIAGTPRYMAPEQARAAWRDLGPWTDLYALGGVAWALATGAAPFRDTEPARLTHRHLYDDPPTFAPRSPVPEGFEAWLRRLLAKPVTARFQCAADARWALSRLDGDRMATPVSFPPAHNAPEPTTQIGLLGADPSTAPGGSTLTDLVAAPDEEPEDTPPPIESVPPPLPADWRLPEAPTPSQQLAGAGLALFGLRQVPLVGRGPERTVLWEALREVAQDGRPRGVMLEGPAGVGKSAIARWFVERAHEAGAATVLVARHEPGGSGSAGLRDMLITTLRVQGLGRDRASRRIRRWLASRQSDDPDDARALAGWLCPDDGDASPFSSPRERLVLITRILAAMATDRPVVLWLDDVPWGSTSVDLVEHLLTTEEGPPVLVVMTARAEALAEQPAARERVDALTVHPRVRPLTVGPLTHHHLARLVRVLLPLRDRLVDALAERADGNPLFAVQLLGDWIQRGLLQATDDGFDLAEGSDPPLPDGLHEVWSGRIDQVLAGPLAPGRPALELAAVLGLEVRDRTWRDALGHAGLDVPDGLVDALSRARLAQPTDDGWRFAHGMLRESLVRAATESGRAPRLHGAIADMLEDRTGLDALATRGRHLLAAGRSDEAADCLLDAAARHALLEDGPATDAMLAASESALFAAGAPPDDPRRVSWQVSAARADRVRRRLERADRHAIHAARLARQHQDRIGLADALTERALIARARGDLPTARLQLAEALQMWRQTDDAAGLIEALRHQGDIAMQAGDLTMAEHAVSEAAELARAAGDAVGESRALLLRGDLARTRMDWPAATDAYRTGLRGLRAAGHRSGVADGQSGLAEVHRYTGDIPAAERNYREVARLDAALGRDGSVTRLNLALCAIARDAWAEALPELEALERTWSNAGRPGYLAVLHVAMLPCLAAVGRWSAWPRHHDEAMRLLDRSGFVDIDIARQADFAAILAMEADRPAEARAALYIAVAQWEALGDDDRAEETERVIGRLAALEAGTNPRR